MKEVLLSWLALKFVMWLQALVKVVEPQRPVRLVVDCHGAHPSLGGDARVDDSRLRFECPASAAGVAGAARPAVQGRTSLR